MVECFVFLRPLGLRLIVSAQPYSNGESGLGLTRVAYEGRCVLDFYVDDENTLAVSAVYRRGAEGAWASR